jgi:cell division protein FtsQ
MAYGCAHFLLTSPRMALLDAEQVEVSGNHNVSRVSVVDVFRGDHGQSVLQVPLGERRLQIESIPWVEQATVRRVLPRNIQVEILERTPIAFLRHGNEMALLDSHGVILDRPLQGDFHFPVVTGISADMPFDEREKRVQLFAGFLEQLDSARAGAVEGVSEVDLSDSHDLRASFTGLETGGVLAAGSAPRDRAPARDEGEAPVLVHFGDRDFEAKYQTLIDKMSQWRATAGRVESVDLRFDGQAVVNSDLPAVARVPKQARLEKRAASTHKMRAKRARARM